MAFLGCGGEPMVSGTVNVDGKPLEKGSISFFPVDGKTHTAGGDIEEGSYSVPVPVGVMKVEIRKPKIKGYKKLYPTPDAKEYPVFEEALPDRYNKHSELKLDVKPGRNQKDFELQGK